MKSYEELAVLEQGEDGAIVSIRGQDGPFVLLGARYLRHLAAVLKQAESDLLRPTLQSGPDGSRALCREIRHLLQAYEDTCLKYCAKSSRPQPVVDLLAEIESLRREIERL